MKNVSLQSWLRIWMQSYSGLSVWAQCSYAREAGETRKEMWQWKLLSGTSWQTLHPSSEGTYNPKSRFHPSKFGVHTNLLRLFIGACMTPRDCTTEGRYREGGCLMKNCTLEESLVQLMGRCTIEESHPYQLLSLLLCWGGDGAC